MAIFSNKIVDVYYTDENLSNVTILYNYEKDGETLVGEYHLLVDETEAQFQDLMKEVTYQDIELATLEMHKAYRNQLQTLVDEEVKKAEEEINKLRLEAPKKINKIAIETSSELIKKLIGAEINNSSISAIVDDLSKKNGDKYYDN